MNVPSEDSESLIDAHKNTPIEIRAEQCRGVIPYHDEIWSQNVRVWRMACAGESPWQAHLQCIHRSTVTRLSHLEIQHTISFRDCDRLTHVLKSSPKNIHSPNLDQCARDWPDARRGIPFYSEVECDEEHTRTTGL